MASPSQSSVARFARQHVVPHSLRGLVVATIVSVALAVVATQFVLDMIFSRLAGGTLTTPDEVGLVLASAAVAVVVGVAMGVWLTRNLRGPVDRLVEHVQTEGYLAAEGAPYGGEHLADDPNLPRELRELGAVVEDLLRHLAARQAELRTAVHEARLAEETLSIAVNDALEGKIIFADGKAVIVNPAASVGLRRAGFDLLGKTIPEDFGNVRVTDEHGENFTPQELFRRSLERPQEIHVVVDGLEDRWYVVLAQRHADDLHNRILVTIRDVTEERRLQQLRSEIVSLVSHDLRTPLSVVVGYLDLLRRPLSEEDRVKAIDAAKRNAGRMADLLEDLLSATRAEELLAATELSPVSLTALAEDVVASMGPTHTDRRFRLAADCRPVIMGDEGRLRQALINLVTNAFKYSPNGTPVEVRVTCGQGRTQLAVDDAGPGVPEADRASIFERFTRLAEEGDRPSGVGLGLYIVRIVSENHGGHVKVEESSLGGARFVIDLPWDGDEELVEPDFDRTRSSPSGLRSVPAAHGS